MCLCVAGGGGGGGFVCVCVCVGCSRLHVAASYMVPMPEDAEAEDSMVLQDCDEEPSLITLLIVKAAKNWVEALWQ